MSEDCSPLHRQHYLPAALIGQFAIPPLHRQRLRHRYVYVRDRLKEGIHRRKAEDVAWRPGYYSVDSEQGIDHSTDYAWSNYESAIPRTIKHLINSRASVLKPYDFIFGLIPFVTSLFTRGLDFEERFADRLRHIIGADQYELLYGDKARERSNTNQTRLIELQRLFAPIMRATWMVFHNDTGTPLILNDRGVATYRFLPGGGDIIYGVLLSPRAILVLRRADNPPKVDLANDTVTGIQHGDLTALDVGLANRGTFHGAVAEVYGPNAEVLSELGPWAAKRTVLPGPEALANGLDLRAHEADWHGTVADYAATHNRMPSVRHLPFLFALNMVPTQPGRQFVSQVCLEEAEKSLAAGRGEDALDSCASASHSHPQSVARWLRRRLELKGFGRRGRSIDDVLERCQNVLNSTSASDHERTHSAIVCALIMLGQGDRELAQSLFISARRTAKSPDKLAHHAAFVLASSSDREGALNVLREAIDGPTAHPKLRQLMGELLIEAEQPQAAIEELRAAADSNDPEVAPRALARLGDLYDQSGREIGLVVSTYQRAAESEQAEPSAAALVRLGQLFLRNGDADEAAKYWKLGTEKLEPYWGALASWNLGWYHYERGDSSSALPFVQRAALSRVEDVGARACLLLGEIYSERDDFEQAVKWLERAVDIGNPGIEASGLLKLGLIFERRGAVVDACRYYWRLAFGSDGDQRAAAAWRCGWLMAEHGNEVAARTVLEQAIRLNDPDTSPSAAIYLGSRLQQQGRPKDALKWFSIAATAQSTAIRAKALGAMGILFHELGDKTRAVDAYEQAIALNDQRQTPIASANLASLLLNGGDMKRARRLLAAAVKGQGPGVSLAWLVLAEMAEELHDDVEAEQSYRTAMAEAQGNGVAAASAHYALFLARLGRVSQARQILEEASAKLPVAEPVLLEALTQVSGANDGQRNELSLSTSVFQFRD